MHADRCEPLTWSSGTWLNPPAGVTEEAADGGTDLVVAATEGSDAWRLTSYGFTHDTAHALLSPLGPGQAMEVEFTADFDSQFDQAGLMVRASAEDWIKAGVEVADGVLNAGAVVTHVYSDWSVAPMPGWSGRRLAVRASRAGDAVTVRACAVGEPFQLLRVAYLDPGAEVRAGPYLCAPTRAGLTVRFHAWRRTEADGALHD